MIVFDGHIGSAAKKCRRSRERKMGLVLCLCGMLGIIPMMLFISRVFPAFNIWYLYGAVVLVLPLMILIPSSSDYLPKRIVLDDDHITSYSEKLIDTKYIEDVKEVRDHGTFYELVFPRGNISHQYFCQKDLLTQGTLEEFEAMFEGKISRETT